MANKKLIFHIDMNAFFCQCAIIKEPFLKEVPFVITSDTNLDKGIVLTSNYLARKSRIYSAMTIIDAKRNNKELRIVPSDYEFYKQKSEQFFNYLKKFTKIILPASIDEAYLDLTDHKLASTPLVLANIIQSSLNKIYNLPVSIGIAHSIYLAKMASDYKKPLGITDLRNDIKILYDESVSSIYGFGKKTSSQLIVKKILTISDFLNPNNKEIITSVISKNYYVEVINQLAGLGSSDLLSLINREAKSISREHTFKENEYLEDNIISRANTLLNEINEELINNNIICSVVFIKYKDHNFKSYTKQLSISPTNNIEIIKTNVNKLISSINLENGIRLIGVGIRNFKKSKTLDLFSKELYE